MIAIRWDNDQQAGPVSLEQYRDVKDAADLFEQLAARTFLSVAVASEGTAPPWGTEIPRPRG
jgi:hypothetical protein